MSDMKCPFCNGELVGTIGHPICRNQDCVMCDDPMPQDLLEELIRTRKALKLALKELKQLKYGGKADRTYLKNKAGKALEQIKELDNAETHI